MALEMNHRGYLLPSIRKGICPLVHNGDNLLVSKGNEVFNLRGSLFKEVKVGAFNEGWIKNILSRNALYTRILRKGFHGMASDHDGNLVGVVNSRLVLRQRGKETFDFVFGGFRGSRPLRLEYTGGVFCFGEYFANPSREPVHIFSSIDGKHWNKSYTFPAGSVRHIHGILDDPLRKGSWVLTGDSDNESKIWFTSDNFKTLEPVVQGGQKARAVNIIARPESLIIPMDSPLEQNYIQRFDVETGQLEPVAKIPGSAFHAIESDGIMLVTTVTEPSLVNKTNAATMWGSLDGIRWKCVCELKRDIFPVRWQYISRYAEIVLTPGSNNTPYITAFGRALKGMDNSMLYWEKQALIMFLKRD